MAGARQAIILASQSPRRQEILARAGIPFDVRVTGVEESRRDGEDPLDYVRRLAQAKASAVPDAGARVVLGADTVVVAGGEILEKPADRRHAAGMLRTLSGRSHEVITGICLRAARRIIVDTEVTRVRFVPLTDDEIESYVATGEPMDKAGAYAIQGYASKFIDRIEGDYFNVVGLPVALVYKHLKDLWREEPW